MPPSFQLIRKPVRFVRRFLAEKRRAKYGLEEIDKCIRAGMPRSLKSGLEAAIARRIPRSSVDVFAAIESIREQIADRGDEQIAVYYSPKPAYGSKNLTAPGARKSFSARQLAHGTSVPADVGQMIHLIAKESRAETIIEFGSCVGIGASYLASVPGCERFITIEASTELSEIATQSVKAVNPQGEVYNEFFNEALDHLLPTLTDGIDFAWIDGHHEKNATVHYFERIRPHLNQGAVVAFDDIYWSDDMLDGWNHLRTLAGFSHAIDVGVCGICIFDGSDSEPQQWSLKEHTRTGVWKPLKPDGWSDD